MISSKCRSTLDDNHGFYSAACYEDLQKTINNLKKLNLDRLYFNKNFNPESVKKILKSKSNAEKHISSLIKTELLIQATISFCGFYFQSPEVCDGAGFITKLILDPFFRTASEKAGITYKKVIEENTFVDVNNKNVALICYPTYNHNISDLILHHDQFNFIKKISESHSVIVVKLESVSDLNKKIEDLNKKNNQIRLLWIHFHGNEDNLFLGKLITPNMINFSKLSPDATIFLHSCFTGKPLKNRLNFAERTQLLAGPARPVYACRTFSSSMTFKPQLNEGKFIGKFCSVFGRDLTASISYDLVLKKLSSINRSKL